MELLNIVIRNCKNAEDTKLPLLRLKEQLFCDYDSSIHPNNFKNNVTVVTLTLMPKLMELVSIHTYNIKIHTLHKNISNYIGL